jgi:deoxyribodipyrimidine photo-lyase
MTSSSSTSRSNALVWLRRDLRLTDHAALSAALRDHHQVHLAFVFDRGILDSLPPHDRRVDFIHRSIVQIDAQLRAQGGALWVLVGDPTQRIPELARALNIAAVYANRDYEPSAIERDRAVAAALASFDCNWITCKDQVIFETDEVMTLDGRSFSVFTPYKRAWLKRVAFGLFDAHPVQLPGRVAPVDPLATWVPDLGAIGFERTALDELGIEAGEDGAKKLVEDFARRIGRYQATRDYPAVKGPSYLSVHLRFGTASIRTLARLAWQTIQADPGAAEGAQTWLSELIWREFYFQILWHHPRVVTQSFRPEYDAIKWDNDPARFEAWCEGRTGYPLVDAAMLQLEHSGYMHNRLRMVTASFLTKDLGIDWRLGEAWFARKLIDFDLAANNGGWQWASSSGCDAQPWFRIFNPVTQSERFDSDGRFIKRYLPSLAALSAQSIHAPWRCGPIERRAAGVCLGGNYPHPIVDHDEARKLTLARYGVVKKKAAGDLGTEN